MASIYQKHKNPPTRRARRRALVKRERYRGLAFLLRLLLFFLHRFTLRHSLSFYWHRASVLLIGPFMRCRHGDRRLLLVAFDDRRGTDLCVSGILNFDLDGSPVDPDRESLD